MVKEFVAIYNNKRSHLALKYKTPDEVHQPFYGQKTVNLYQEQLKPGMWMSVDYVAVAEGVLKGYRDNGLSYLLIW